MDPRHWRQPQIIRLLAGTYLAVLALAPARVSAQTIPCVSCLVLGVDAEAVSSAGQLQPASLEGVQLLVPEESWSDALGATGASVSILVALPSDIRPIEQLVFGIRTAMTALRAAHPGVPIVLDSDALAARAVPLELVAPYADAVIGQGWTRLPERANPTVDDLIRASLTPGGERVLLPVTHLEWRVVQDYASRRPTLVEVTGSRRLSVGEILARYQAEQRRQDSIVRTTIATGTTTLLFEVPDFSAPITITADTRVFRGPQGTDIEERNIRVNGAAIAGGGAQRPPELPLIEAERISTPPLTITLNEAYGYTREADETVGNTRCYVISFEPRIGSRGLARGRAWIDTRQFTLRRLQTIQRDLRGAIVSSEQVDEFGRVEAGGTGVWLPIETRIFQSYEGAGFRTPIHRTITVRRYDVNSPAFEAELRAALASDNVMMRDTPQGLRYLVRTDKTGDRAAVARGGHSIRSLIGGVLVDPNISRPLAFAGLSYINLDLFGRGAQLNVFFGGVFGQLSWSVPSIGGTRWQAHGSAFAIAAQYSDRVFRNGREQYDENLLQRPGSVSVGVLRPLTPRIRATADYSFEATGIERTANTPDLFEVPRSIVNHAAVLGLEADHGAWSLRAWWNPAMRDGWRRWGLPGTFNPATHDYQRYGLRLRRTLALRSPISSRLELSWMGGRDLDRFSRYGFDAFESPLHGYPTASIRFDRGVVARTATAWTWRGLRVDGFGDTAIVRDPGWASNARIYPGVGAGVEAGGPFRTLVSVEWGYGFRAPRQDGGRGAQTTRVTLYKGF